MPPQDQNQNMNPPTSESSAPRSGVGPLIGAAIVIALLILGGLYFWGAKLNQEGMQDQLPYIPGDETGEGAQDDATLNAQTEMELNQALPQQSTSDDVDSIEDDFGAMDIDAITTQTSGDASAFGEEAQ